MKKIFTILTLSMAGAMLTASARQLSPAEALRRVNENIPAVSKLRAKANPVPTMAVKAVGSDFTGLYVFSDNHRGFLVVSADDCAIPLLGYSDRQPFEATNVAPQMKAWLQFYADEIQWASRRSNLTVRSAAADRPVREAIAPLTKSEWNQGAPYNDDCPEDDGGRCVTGCVATAMAQAMYYHQWPEKGTGSESYEWNGQTLSVDFANTTYDWANMTDTYDASSTEAQNAAVATLMYSCGVSVEMDYSSDESGANSYAIAPALYKYFGYDISMYQPLRSLYGLIDWENLVYGQLSENIPVLYGGQSNDGGHQFICDGYSSDGYFHFNWGWGGMSNGYFLLSALNPESQGIGGSADEAGYNYEQNIIVGMKKAQAGSKVTPFIVCYGNFETEASGPVALGNQIPLVTGEGFVNLAAATLTGYYGVKAVDSEGNVSYISSGQVSTIEPLDGVEGYYITLPSDLAAGTYTLTPAFLANGEESWSDIMCPVSGSQALGMTVSGGEATFENLTSVNVDVTDVTFNTPVYLDADFEATITITNNGENEYYCEYNFYLVNSDGEAVEASNNAGAIDLQPGETKTTTYVGMFASTIEDEDTGETSTVSPGQYYIALVASVTDQELYITSNLMDIEEAPENTVLKINSITVGKVEETTDNTVVTLQGEVECTEGYFAGQLSVAVFPTGATETSMQEETDYIILDAGDKKTFTVNVNMINVKEGESFFAMVQNDGKWLTDPNEFTFTLGSTSVSGIESESILIGRSDQDITVSAVTPIASLSLYSLDGRLLHQSAPCATEAVITLTDCAEATSLLLVIRDASGGTRTLHLLK